MLLQDGEDIGLTAGHGAAFTNLHLVAVRRDDRERIGADVGKASDPLAPLDALEQEGVLAAFSQLQVGRYWRLQIGRDHFPNRNQVALSSKFTERLKIWLDHARRPRPLIPLYVLGRPIA